MRVTCVGSSSCPEVAALARRDPDSERITLTVTDGADGSGVAVIYSTLLTEPTKAQRYTGPFVVPAGTPIRMMPLDRAGNTEQPHSAEAVTPTHEGQEQRAGANCEEA